MDLLYDLPIDLQYIVANYNHTVFFALPISELAKYDWFKLLRMNFSLSYSRESFTNEEIMKVYLDNLIARKLKIICHGNFTIIKSPDGSLFSSGYDVDGQLGGTRSLKFEGVPGIPKNVFVAEVICGRTHTIIRLMDGTLMSSGNNVLGQLGHGDELNRVTFSIIKGVPNNIIQMACGLFHTIIRLTDGTLMSCGDNKYGQLGLGDSKNRNIFNKITGIPKNTAEVMCGEYHTLIKFTDGTLMSCGYNRHGQLGLVNGRSTISFTKIPHIPTNIAKVICNTHHTIIQLTNGILMACGNNRSGQLGFGCTLGKNSFSEIIGIPKNIAEVASGPNHTIIRLTDGKIFGTGYNRNGELCLADNMDRNEFTEITGIPANIAQIICWSHGTIIRLTNGKIMAYGKHSLGKTIEISKDIADMTSYNDRTIVSLTDGTLMSVGYNGYGELGIGNSSLRTSHFAPIQGIPKINCMEW
ncbi:MAG: chromosome condensation regulator [Hyperionvirus sp.]|uniref:Chromosome condensation regulator n=1 Tax=Hyperionvirus sp. TaxID=2487770 RepID=A0A3G5A9C2_9VIRU|nr:MAG: chromosome condensation regulator [Hyperionvirus sp.]